MYGIGEDRSDGNANGDMKVFLLVHNVHKYIWEITEGWQMGSGILWIIMVQESFGLHLKFDS